MRKAFLGKARFCPLCRLTATSPPVPGGATRAQNGFSCPPPLGEGGPTGPGGGEHLFAKKNFTHTAYRTSWHCGTLKPSSLHDVFFTKLEDE